MSIESGEDLRGMRAAGRVVARTIKAMRAAIRIGMTTAELDRVAADYFKRQGARSAPQLAYNFPGCTCISVNDEIVHGIPGGRKLRRGDVVKLDVTAEKGGYVADAARTVVLDGAADRAQQLAACAEAAFEAALRVARPGNRVNMIGRAIEEAVTGAGFAIAEGLEGHGVGRAIHEPPSVPNYFNRRQKDILSEGLVITIEPLITAGKGAVYKDSDGWTIRTMDGSVTAHHEHTLVITSDGPVLLT